MGRKGGKTATLNRFLAVASDQWNIEGIRLAIERTAEAVWQVEQFALAPEEEPACAITAAHEARWRSKRAQE